MSNGCPDHRFLARAGTNANDSRHPGGLVLRTSALVICWWSLVETALDFALIDGDTALAPAIGTRLIALACGLAVALDLRLARPVFRFLCAMSVLALAPTLALGFNGSLVQPVVSFIDCATKAFYLICASPTAARSHDRGWRIRNYTFALSEASQHAPR
jgi:hypothetical protein